LKYCEEGTPSPGGTFSPNRPGSFRQATGYILEVSSSNADGDNLIRAFEDALAERYGFIDCDIHCWAVGFIELELLPHRQIARIAA
jgi:hypothetical protein